MLEYFKHKTERRCLFYPLIGFTLLIVSSCQNPLTQDDLAQVSLQIQIESSENLSKTSALAGITRVDVTVSTGVFETASYKELTVKELTISDRSAQGSISVPMGEDRTFRVRAFDANGFIQYSGRTKIDVLEKTFTVQIGLKPLPPNRPTLSLDVPTGKFSWTKSIALDFAAYELYRAPTAGVTVSSDLIYTPGAIDSTFHVDNDTLASGKYYYRVYVVDTEDIRSAGSNEVERIHSVVP